MLCNFDLFRVADIAGKDELGYLMGYTFSSFTLGTLIAPVLGGIMFERLGFISSFILVLVLIVVDFFAQLFYIEPLRSPSNLVVIELSSRPEGATEVEAQNLFPILATQDEPIAPNMEGNTDIALSTESLTHIQDPEQIDKAKLGTFKKFLVLLTNARLMMVLSIIATLGLCIACLDVYLPLHLAQLGYDSSQIGLIMLCFILPEILFSPVAGMIYDKVGFKRTFLIGCVWVIIMFPVIGISQGIVSFCILLGVGALGAATVSAPLMAEVAKLVPSDTMAQAYGLLNVAIAIGMFVGPLVGSFIFESFNWFGVCTFVAAAFIIAFPIGLFYHS